MSPQPGQQLGSAEAPLVSVVVPIYNASLHLSATLQSVRKQTLTAWELIAVDDGSTDGSAELVADWARSDPRVRLLRQANAGVSVARNRGVAASGAPLLAFLDADDLWHPDKLRNQLACHHAHPELGVSFARVEFLTPAGAPTGQLSARCRQPLQAAQLLYENPTTTTSNWVILRQVFEAVGGFVETMSYSEDLEWLLRVACDGRWPIQPLDQVLTYYRTSEGGLSSSLARMEQGWLRLVSEARCYAPELVDQNFASARAVQLRYLARRSLRLRADPAQGVDFMRRALQSDWRRLIQEPRRTIATAVAVAVRLLFSRAKAVLPTFSPSKP
jgi:glycosyltransferase involved in cell wall biosynthesis